LRSPGLNIILPEDSPARLNRDRRQRSRENFLPVKNRKAGEKNQLIFSAEMATILFDTGLAG